MKRVFAGAALLGLVLVGSAAARPSDHLTPGTPGTKNCRGQTAAYLAQAAKNGLVLEAFHGIGGIARGAELSVKEVQAVIEEFCAGAP